MDAYRVIRHPGEEDERARWACGARRQRGPVKIASGPAPAVLRLGRIWLCTSFGGGIFLFLPWLSRLVGLTNRQIFCLLRATLTRNRQKHNFRSWLNSRQRVIK